MRKCKRQWFSPACVSAVFAVGILLGLFVKTISVGLVQEIIFIGAAVLTFHLSNLVADILKENRK